MDGPCSPDHIPDMLCTYPHGGQFATIDPTHFRNLSLELCLHVERADGSRLHLFGEIQLHHFLILKYNMECQAEVHYEFFRSHLKVARPLMWM